MAKKKAPRVIIEVRGGCVVAIYSDRKLDWDILDWDGLGEDPKVDRQMRKLEIETKELRDVTEHEECTP